MSELNVMTMENVFHVHTTQQYDGVYASNGESRKIICSILNDTQVHGWHPTFGFGCCTDTKFVMITTKIITRLALSHSLQSNTLAHTHSHTRTHTQTRVHTNRQRLNTYACVLDDAVKEYMVYSIHACMGRCVLTNK